MNITSSCHHEVVAVVLVVVVVVVVVVAVWAAVQPRRRASSEWEARNEDQTVQGDRIPKRGHVWRDLQNANASHAVNVFETFTSINDSIVNHMSRDFHVFWIFSRYNTFVFQAFYDVVMALFSLMDRRAQNKVKTLYWILCIMSIFSVEWC